MFEKWEGKKIMQCYEHTQFQVIFPLSNTIFSAPQRTQETTIYRLRRNYPPGKRQTALIMQNPIISQVNFERDRIELYNVSSIPIARNISPNIDYSMEQKYKIFIWETSRSYEPQMWKSLCVCVKDGFQSQCMHALRTSKLKLISWVYANIYLKSMWFQSTYVGVRFRLLKHIDA